MGLAPDLGLLSFVALVIWTQGLRYLFRPQTSLEP
jgi:hypothetical protein